MPEKIKEGFMKAMAFELNLIGRARIFQGGKDIPGKCIQLM